MTNLPYQLGHHFFTANNSGWTCPRCQNVYAPFMMECASCNKKSNQLEPQYQLMTQFDLDIAEKQMSDRSLGEIIEDLIAKLDAFNQQLKIIEGKIQTLEVCIDSQKNRYKPEKTTGLNFWEAYQLYKKGYNVRTNQWPNENYTLKQYFDDCDYEPEEESFLSQKDLDATDWEIVE